MIPIDNTASSQGIAAIGIFCIFGLGFLAAFRMKISKVRKSKKTSKNVVRRSQDDCNKYYSQSRHRVNGRVHNTECELADPYGPCECSCNGRYHGVLVRMVRTRSK